jgi:myo-inositol-1(or 4)-monophosphatase
VGAGVTASADDGGIQALDLLDLAVTTARAAGELIVEGRHGQVRVAETKSSPTDVVTDNDVASERLIRSRILSARPADGFVGEEGESVEGTSGVRWVADPIDGTVNYLYGIPQYAVSIAAEKDGRSVVGAVLDATSGELFTAVRGGGARRDGEPISVSSTTELSQTLVGTGYHYRSDVRVHQAAELARLLPRIRDVRRLGSAALDLCYVACGRLDAYVERGLRPWDLAAARLVVEEAGGVVEGVAHDEPTELLTMAAPRGLADVFRAELVACGFADWPMPQWPPLR